MGQGHSLCHQHRKLSERISETLMEQIHSAYSLSRPNLSEVRWWGEVASAYHRVKPRRGLTRRLPQWKPLQGFSPSAYLRYTDGAGSLPMSPAQQQSERISETLMRQILSTEQCSMPGGANQNMCCVGSLCCREETRWNELVSALYRRYYADRSRVRRKLASACRSEYAVRIKPYVENQEHVPCR